MKKIIIYDFDGTLTPFPMPKLEFLEKCGFKDGLMNEEFGKRVAEISKRSNVDKYRALYEALLSLLNEKNIRLDNKTLALGSDKVIYNKGVEEFLEYLNNNGVSNYLLSSGIKPFLYNVSIAPLFKDIYATTFKYDKDIVVNVDFLMSDLNKVEAIKDIMRVNNIKDCSDIIYIGDGLTDYFAMEFVVNNNGKTIFVYKDYNEEYINKMKSVISYHTKNDFSLNKELVSIVKELCDL
ncbi:MAG: haloacid dehalogenase-like hydrolase [Bacilli bacterium]|nr:haloacid dehalogenase-like hydrolase [Bacilli bacterium]